MVSRPSEEMICLDGSPRQVGRAFGRVNARSAAADVKRFYRSLRTEEKIPVQRVMKEGKCYLRLVRRYAPHWLNEARALAQAAGVDAERYIIYQGAKYRGINRGECFTYYSAPNVNAGKVTLFHKNRDNRARPQCAYVKGVRVAGRRIYRFMANADTMDMGTMMALNEKGLAVAADTGGPDPHPRWRGMMNPEVMRVILERAADVDEGLEILREFHRDKTYAGGKIATNWMLADHRGKGLRVHQTHERLVLKRSARDFMVMRDADARGRLVKRVLSRNRGKITWGLLNQLSRRRPVLQDTNVSAFTAVIPDRQIDLFGWANFAVSNAGTTLYVPLYMGVTATPRVLVDGTLFALSNKQPYGRDLFAKSEKRKVDMEQLEEDMDADRACMEQAARLALRREGRRAARLVLTDGCLRLAGRAERILRLLRR